MQNIITFASMTAAMRARELLRRNRIPARMTRTPAKYRRGSCGYSLVLERDADAALKLLRQSDIRYRGVFADDDR